MGRGRLRTWLLAAGTGSLSGLLFWLSIPKADLYLLAWVCLVPGFVLVARRPCPAPGLVGLSAGLIAGVGRIYWLGDTLQLYGSLSAPLAWLTTALLVLYLALYWTCFFALSSRITFFSPFFPWTAASAWVLLEWAQNWVITGFPWELLGYSQYLNRPVLQLASLTGVYGLSFLLVVVNATVAQALVWRSLRLAVVGPPLALLVVVVVWGDWRSRSLEEEPAANLVMGIVQGNVPQGEKWKSTASWTTRHYAELVGALARDRRLDLVVFPETALPFYFRDPSRAEFEQEIADLARQTRTPLLVGSLERVGDAVYNRAFLIDTTGAVSGYSDKAHLVPFGEYLPLPWLFQYMEGLTAESGAFSPGARHRPLRLSAGGPDFGVFICYESIYPEISRTLARQGAAFLVNTTNDAWFGRSAAPYQHFSMAVVRAVETGRPVLRVANTGISGCISPTGRIVLATALFETVALSVPLTPRSASTFYLRWGDAFLVACGLFLAARLAAHAAGGTRRIAQLAGRAVHRG